MLEAISPALRGALRSPFSEGSDLSFSIGSLFAASEPGVWLDPSDFSTMFQDAAGTTPVTAVGQPVGLMLDKSQGLVLRPEQRSTGAAGLQGTATAATFNATTFAGAATRVDVNNQSFVVFSGFTPNAFVRITLQCLTGTALIRAATLTSPGGSNATIVAGQTVTSVIQATATGTMGVASTANGTTSTFIVHSVRELPGNHATQTTSTSRPVLQQDGNGKYYLQFDGVDDWLITPTITPGVDKVQVFAGVRKLSDAAAGVLAELSASIITNNGAFALIVPSSDSPSVQYASKGTSIAGPVLSGLPAPISLVLVGSSDIAAPAVVTRVNGSQMAQSSLTQGTGNFLAYPIYIGRRAGANTPVNGHLYGLIVRFGANLPAATIASTETWLNQRTGAY